jgi:RimJ/RimL family protein N-acetyltransferase
MKTFPPAIRVPIKNHLTNASYELVRASDLIGDPTSPAHIAAICSEPEVYDSLFRIPFEGRAYTEENARQWLHWSQQGWSAATHFVFAVIDEHQNVVAACDIKTSDDIAEIGYWASRSHRGVMTNAVKALSALASEAGFVGLYARTQKQNTKSQAVLIRAGFERNPSDGEEHSASVSWSRKV